MPKTKEASPPTAETMLAWFKRLRWKSENEKGWPRRFTKDGWSALLSQNGELHFWGPDKLAVIPPSPLTMTGLEANLKRCQYCLELSAEIKRLGFAGRACPPCREKLAPEIEAPGWNK